MTLLAVVSGDTGTFRTRLRSPSRVLSATCYRATGVLHHAWKPRKSCAVVRQPTRGYDWGRERPGSVLSAGCRSGARRSRIRRGVRGPGPAQRGVRLGLVCTLVAKTNDSGTERARFNEPEGWSPRSTAGRTACNPPRRPDGRRADIRRSSRAASRFTARTRPSPLESSTAAVWSQRWPRQGGLISSTPCGRDDGRSRLRGAPVDAHGQGGEHGDDADAPRQRSEDL
jgi:hypothetical protein